MEELYEFSSRYADVPVDVVQGFIDQPYSPDCDAILGDILRLDLLRKLDSALQRQEHHRSIVDSTTGSTDAPAALKRICAAVQHTMLQTKESAVLLLSSTVLLRLTALPSAGAYGLSNTNTISALIGAVAKPFAAELKQVQKLPTAASVSDRAAMDVDVAITSQSRRGSRRTATAAADYDDDDDAEGSDNEDSSADMQTSSSTAMSPVTEQAVKQWLAVLLDDAAVGRTPPLLLLLAQQQDEQLLNSTADIFTTLLFLSHVHPQYLASDALCIRCVKTFSTSNRAALIAQYRSLTPMLSLQARNHMLLDVFKVRRACHGAAVKVMQELIPLSCCSVALSMHTSEDPPDCGSPSASASSAPNIDEEDDTEVVEDEGRDDTGNCAAPQQRSSPSPLPLPHTLAVGLFQRLTMTPPERAQSRQLVHNAIISMLTSWADAVPSTSTTAAAEVQDHGAVALEASRLLLKSIQHYLTFLNRLAKSNRIGHRAFCLEIAAQLVGSEWIWQLPLVGRSDSMEENAVANKMETSPKHHAAINTPGAAAAADGGEMHLTMRLITLIIGRCSDCAPTVRIRALSAMHELLVHMDSDNGGASSQRLANILFDLAMGLGADSSCSSDGESSSFIDVVRQRCVDEATIVRSKALQAMGKIYSIQWRRNARSAAAAPSASPSATMMLLTGEDMQVFAAGCRDSSISVRKTALSAFTEVLLARPADITLQEVWIQSALPLACDSESTVIQRLAELVHRVVFSSVVTWFTNSFLDRDAVAVAGDAETAMLPWRLCSKINRMGLFKLLRSLLCFMLKQGVLRAVDYAASDSPSADSILSVLNMLKTACSSVADSNVSEVETVESGAWVLLEALVAQDVNLKVINAQKASVSFLEFVQKAGSTDFVISCYKQKHGFVPAAGFDRGVSTTICWDESDLRIFRVLERLGANMAERDMQFIVDQIMHGLRSMSCDCQIAGATIAVLMKVAETRASMQQRQQAQQGTTQNNAVKAVLTPWVDAIFLSVTAVLSGYVFKSRTADAAVAAGPMQLMQQWLDLSSDKRSEMPFDDVNISSISANSISLVSDRGDAAAAAAARSQLEQVELRLVSMVQTALFLLGEMAMMGFSMEEDYHAAASAVHSAAGDAGKTTGFRFEIPEDVRTLVKLLMGHQLPAAADDGSSKERPCPNKIRANAFVTMGKMCMRNKSLAQSQVNILLREIAVAGTTGPAADSDSGAAVRSNALLVLGDMCVRFTHLVDRHVDQMALCLQDRSALVRKTALLLLTQLLLQDYLKWKGFLLYRFIVLVVDPDPEIAEFARSVLQRTLSFKFPQLLSLHFTETIIILNGCTQHPVYKSTARTAHSEVDNATLNPGGENGSQYAASAAAAAAVEELMVPQLGKQDRFAVYSFMAENLEDEGRIQVCAKLVQDILSAAVDQPHLLPNRRDSIGSGRGSNGSFEVALADTLELLRSPSLRVGSKKQSGDDAAAAAMDVDTAGLEQELAQSASSTAGSSSTSASAKAALNMAKMKVLKKLSSQHLISHTLPVVISLKHQLEALRSPMQGPVMEYLVAIMKSHKSEVEEVLQSDPSLKAEVEYDLKVFERQQEARRLKEQLMNEELAHNAPSTGRRYSAGDALSSGARSVGRSGRMALKSPYVDAQELRAHPSMQPTLRKSAATLSKLHRSAQQQQQQLLHSSGAGPHSPGYDRLISDLTSQQRSASRTAPKQQQQQQQLQQQASDDKENDAVGRLVACSDDASECDDGVIDAPDAAAPADAANTADAAVVRSSSASDFLQLVASPAVTGKRRSWGVVVDSIQAPAEGTGGSPVSVNSDEPKSPQRAAATVAAAGGRDGKKKLRQGAAGSKYTPVKKRGKQSSSPMLLKAAGGAAREAGKQPKNSSCCSSNSMRAAAAAPLNSLLNLTTVSNLSTEKNSLSTDSIEAVAASADAAVDGGKASANGQAKRVFSRSRAAAAAGANSLMAIL